jgi:hypothetical protein
MAKSCAEHIEERAHFGHSPGSCTTADQFFRCGREPIDALDSATADGAARRLGDIEGDLYLTAAWSPDGHKLLFVKGQELWIGNADGSQSQRLVAMNGQPEAPAFSPDGKRIRFTLMDLQAHTFALWEVLADGSNLHPLLPKWQENPHECCGIWTRDGRYFLFRTSISNEDFGDIYALRDSIRWIGESPKPVQLTLGPMRFELGPTTPDDKKLLVAGFEHGEN